MEDEMNSPGYLWRKEASRYLVSRKLWTRVREDVCKYIGRCIDEGKIVKAEDLIPIVGRHDVACQTVKLFWDGGLLKRRKGVGRSWLYYAEKNPPEFLRRILGLDGAE